MPEGHTLHRIAGELQPIVGRRVRASSPQGRFASGASDLDGRILEASEAYGKHLLLDFGHDHLHIHLGLAGKIFPSDAEGESRPGVRLRLVPEPPDVAWNFVAPHRCELFDEEQRAALLARLGPDPLRDDDPAPAFDRISVSSKPIGELLMDQRVIAGVGNVFRAEVLHHCRVHPLRAGQSLGRRELNCMWRTLVRYMKRAVLEGRIVTVDTRPTIDRSTIADVDGRFVYKQEHCRTCGHPVSTYALANRVAYVCEHCQKQVP